MSRPAWTAENIPDQRGRTAVITGANTGTGFEAARILAGRGAAVVLACRNSAKAADAADRIRAAVPGSTVTTLRLDLASQASVREAAEEVRAGHGRIDLLVNNAGMLGSRERTVTEDGFEATFATNHLGAFAFTGLVLDRLLPVPGSRVVTVSSIVHRGATLDFDDLQTRAKYRRDAVYGASKLANLMFTYELQRQLAASRARTVALAAHPGMSRTEFTRDLSPANRFLFDPRIKLLTGWILQDRAIGALGMVRAAVDPEARGGECYGPPGRAQLTGHPVRVESSATSHDAGAQGRLWRESERLTGVSYPLTRIEA
ncbi:oxidoreductase [Streptomyces corynorhini]|uniref:SDR family NAD(P)-dependent oxidoreductase n=1 Tax=Streptomyces corynorhini TaxID=2282652 RepID=A0A370BEQ8_9ACTN|nr:oxidoreductase [Streptomyces corynorhini]RDG38196.1 SDR family NAD(P)-dependent oxidoreductase [Streptomyces corynorhini]